MICAELMRVLVVFDLVDQRRAPLPPTPRQNASLIMYRLVVIPPRGGFFWSQTVGIVTSLRVIFNAAFSYITGWNYPTDQPSPGCHAPHMDTHHVLEQAMWEVIAEMERACLQGGDDQVLR